MKTNKRALIFTGGSMPDRSMLTSQVADLIIAADSGYDVCLELGIRPHLLVGDFDSITCHDIDPTIPRKQLPTHKDVTDTMLACECAVEQGATELIILGGLGGREDHSLSNIFYLENLKDRGISARISDGQNDIRLLSDETVVVPRSDKKYFSLFALDSCVVTASGCEYPLTDYTLTRKNSFAVSNEITAAAATVTVRGKVLLAQSK